MYGDCQVESLFGSPIRNPNLNFMSSNIPTSYHPSFSSAVIIPKEESNMIQGDHTREEDIESGSMGTAHLDGDLQDADEHQPKKKRYHRHTAHQIQEMENLFKECPHPDEKQRMKLSQELGLKPRQVKFWFQNRRTQMKAQQDRAENMILKAENDNLKNENYRLQAALRSITCANCGGPGILGDGSVEDQHLRIENARLKDELERFSTLIPHDGRPTHTIGLAPPSLLLPSVDLGMNVYSSRHFPEPMGTCTSMIPVPSLHDTTTLSDSNLIMEQDKPLALEFAMNAMDELIKMSQLGEPLWIQNGNGAKEVLNTEVYSNMFPLQTNFKQQAEFRIEATRDTCVVIMNSITLVDAFLDTHKWMELFPSIVARARTVQTITSGIISGHGSGSLQLMYAEMQALSPLIPTREAHFLRYCQQNAEEGTWAIIDLPIDSLNISHQYSLPRYRRRPSGCIIQDMPNGYSRVTWVEHAEIEDKAIHQIFNELVNSGTAFGAHRWLAVLQQQCERLASLMARNISDLGVIPSPEARRNLMKLTQRMIRTFCFNISTSGGQSWTAISDSAEDTIRITTRKNTEPGQPNGIILCAVSTTWLPFTHQQVFDLLRDERRRSQLDVLASGTSSHEVAHIANGSHPGNCISLLRINASSNSSQNVELMLQESSTDKSASLVVYSSVDVDAIQLAMNGEDPSYIPLLPLGFVVTPMRPSIASSEDGNGVAPSCLLTVGVQVLASTIPCGKINLSNVTAINTHICNVVHQINTALEGGVATPGEPSLK